MNILPALFILLLSVNVATASNFTETSYYYAWPNDTCTEIIGIKPQVEIHTTALSKVCVQWYDNGMPAYPPNSNQYPMDYYCRTTDDEGITFFAMHKRLPQSYPVIERNALGDPNCPPETCCSVIWDDTGLDLTIYDIGLMVLSIDGVEPDLPYIPLVF